MGNQEIVQKLWNLCNVLRDDGITYHQYVTELTYILFLKMMKEKDIEDTIEKNIVGYKDLKKKNEDGTITKNEQQEFLEKKKVAEYSWDTLVSLSGIELKNIMNKSFICLENTVEVTSNPSIIMLEPILKNRKIWKKSFVP